MKDTGHKLTPPLRPKKFGLPIALIIFNLFFLNIYYFISNHTLKILIVNLSLLICAWILYFFKKFIENFDDGFLPYFVGKMIKVDVALSILFLTNLFFYPDSPLLHTRYVGLFVLVLIAVTVLLFVNIVLGIRLGERLKQIKNDDTGLLKLLGNLLIYFYPAIMICFIVIFSVRPLRHFYKDPHNVWLPFVFNTISYIPYLVMALVFYREGKATKQGEH